MHSHTGLSREPFLPLRHIVLGIFKVLAFPDVAHIPMHASAMDGLGVGSKSRMRS